MAFMPGNGGATVRVVPSKSAGGVVWRIEKGGVTQGQSYNYKDDAVKKARKVARKANGKLIVKNTDGTTSETVNYS